MALQLFANRRSSYLSAGRAFLATATVRKNQGSKISLSLLRLIHGGARTPALAPRAPRASLVQQLRGLSTNSETIVDDDKTDYENVTWKDMTTWEKVQYATYHYGLYGVVGGSFAYVVSKLSMYLTSTMMGLSFKTVGWWGFLVGYGSGVVSVGGAYAATRGLYIRPERVRKEAFNIVNGNAKVQQLMELSVLSPLKSGTMRAYTMDGGHVAIDSASRRIVWRKPRVKLMFQVYSGAGKKTGGHQAVVCAEATKAFSGGLEFEFISVDFLTINDELPVLVTGRPERFKTEGQLRDLVQLNRRYV